MEHQTVQLDLFAHVREIYADAGRAMSNAEVYAALVDRGVIAQAELDAVRPIGRAKAAHSPVKRRIRWIQQTLKQKGQVKRVGQGRRSLWAIAEKTAQGLSVAPSGLRVVAFHTQLGMALWGRAEETHPGETATLILTSPPYPLASQRRYGNVDERQYVDWLCRALEPSILSLGATGSLALNLSPDIFMPKSPARSTYIERTILALEDRFGLHLMDRLVWENPSRPPGPVLWSSKTRQQLVGTYELVLWFAVDPLRCKADNRRVLLPHTERQRRLIERGGEARTTSYGDGAIGVRPGSFGTSTPGRIPRNVLTIGHRCSDTDRVRADAVALNLPPHGAAHPLRLVEFLLAFLTDENDLAIDPFAGTHKLAMAAERLRRRWLTIEWALDYLRAAMERFRGCPGFASNPQW